MNYTLARSNTGYLVFAETVEPSPEGRRAQIACVNLGTMMGAELSQGLDAQMTYIVAKDGFASVEPGDAAYAELDAIAIRLAPLTETPSVFVLPESDD